MKAKIIISNGGFSMLENELNHWLEVNSKVKVISVSYADNNSYCSALIIYK